ncbi:hypothetical protein PHMEG_0007751 [Phytophthora megakarya]|uniref:Uncharacterized protein n=1 Tax=Phytophthora megakarya TaxID=4795 RepID=A0A225WKH5_9STRA|nr:hypothetical protein PHMEG_0007751 [Phytophthora megakarya]
MSLSDEETARALCAFQHPPALVYASRTPVESLPPYPTPSETPQLRPDARVDGLSPFGYPANATYTYHKVPISRRKEAASVLMGMHTPSISEDWHQLQQRAIQEQLEQGQQELQEQCQWQQQQQVQRQLAQVQQQEQAQMQQMQRIQPRYATWPSDVSNVHSAREAMQSTQVYDGMFGRSRQVPIRPTPAFTSTPISSFASDYRQNCQPQEAATRSNEMFAPQQVPQTAQSHLLPRNCGNLATSAFHQWGRTDFMLCGEIPTDRTMTAQRYMPQQPHPYYPTQGRESSCQDTMTQRNSTRSSNDVFLNGIKKHFPASAGYDNSPPATADATASSNYVYVKAQTNIPLFSSVPIQSQGRNQTLTQMQGQMYTQPRPSVPPAGSAVIPGVSLASQSVRLLTMRDILNGEDAPNKLDSSRNRQRMGKQKRDPPKRKTLRKQTTTKRRRIPKQENKQRFQPLQSNRPFGGILSRQTSLPPSKTLIKPSTPMYRAFMESRAARASEQAAVITNTTSSAADMNQLLTKSDSRTSDVRTNVIAGMKKLDAPSRNCYLTSTHQTNQQPAVNTSASAQGAAKLKSPWDNTECTESLPTVGERETLINGQRLSADFDSLMDEVQDQQLLPHPPQLPVSTTLVSSVNLDAVVGNNKTSASSKKRRRPVADSNGLHTGNMYQQVSTPLPSTQELSKVAFPATAFSTIQTPALPELPRAENRTVVIFCKRDFMRYQAAKIWRKYQEQLKKHEEWREVRVAGKRTRYLNSRYDELQRTPRKSYTRSGKSRKQSSKAAKGPRSKKELVFTTESASGDSGVSSSVSLVNETRDKGNDESAASVDGVQSVSEKPGSAGNDSVLTAPHLSEPSQQQIEDGIKSGVEESVSRDLRSGGVEESVAPSGFDCTISDGNLPTAANAYAHNSDAVTEVPLDNNKEPPSAVREVTPVVANAETVNNDLSITDLPYSGSADTVTTDADVETPITESFSSCCIDTTSSDLDNGVSAVVPIIPPKSNVTATTVADPSTNGSIEIIDAATDGSAVERSVHTDVNMEVKQSTDEESEDSVSNGKHLGEENVHDKLADTQIKRQ